MPRINDEQVAWIIGTLLRVGVILAAATVLAAGIWYLAEFGGAAPDHHAFRGEPSDLRSIPGIVRGAVSLRQRDVIQFGLLLLIATPVLRVAFSVAAFALEGDRIYVVITLIVLAILLFSLAGGQ